ncbi:MAG: nucleotide exchange factor GrpE [Blastocatellia bacterium]|nr:nucleotide exchange factor GrpE [Blastocatellia bacterium]MBL8196711.1 nucleotide exchange factor GrpE [Blastocatellia bacterium]
MEAKETLSIEFEELTNLLSNLPDKLSLVLVKILNEHLTEFSTKLEKSSEQLAELERNITKLNRVQYKANTLSEAQEQKTTTLLTTLQETIKQQEKQIEENIIVKEELLAKEKKQALSAFALNILPVLDGIESAINNGYTLLKRKDKENITSNIKKQTVKETIIKSKKLTLMERLKVAFTGEISIEIEQERLVSDNLAKDDEILEMLEALNATKESIKAWLEGLELVKERFTVLLANEGIHQIETEGKLFDPRLHVALEAITDSNLSPGTIASVLRKGYQQENKILRYAEVVVVKESK